MLLIQKFDRSNWLMHATIRMSKPFFVSIQGVVDVERDGFVDMLHLGRYRLALCASSFISTASLSALSSSSSTGAVKNSC